MTAKETTSAPTRWLLSASKPSVPKAHGESISQKPSAIDAIRYHGSETPQNIPAGRSRSSRVSPSIPASSSESFPPIQKACQSDAPSSVRRFRSWNMATTSSNDSEIIQSMPNAESRHSVHHVPTRMGWEITRRTCTNPSGMTTMPKNVTIQGIVRHRVLSPMNPISPSSAYATAPSPASEMGNACDSCESRIRRVPSPKTGSQTASMYPSW